MKEDFDVIIASLGDGINRMEERLTKVCEEKIEMMKDAYERICKIVDGNDVKVKMRLHEPYKDRGYISISGSEIIITDTNEFCRIVSASQNLDFWPKNGGIVDVILSYNGLMEE